MVRTFLKVYMELGSYFLFLQEQTKDIIIKRSPQTTTPRNFLSLCLAVGSIQEFSFGGFLYVEGCYLVSVLSACLFVSSFYAEGCYSSLCPCFFFLVYLEGRSTSLRYQVVSMVSPFSRRS
jgi:hypothetical protein